MIVTEEIFTCTMDAWMADVRTAALKLFRDGCAHDHCLNVAMKVVEARDVHKARTAQELGAGPRRILS